MCEAINELLTANGHRISGSEGRHRYHIQILLSGVIIIEALIGFYISAVIEEESQN